MKFAALRGLGVGSSNGLIQTPSAASVLNLNSLNVPHLYRTSSWCASPFIVGALRPLWPMAQD